MPMPDLASALRACWRPVGRLAARTYIAGPDLGDALEVGRRAERRGLATAIGFWDGGEAPRAVADAYLRALDGMAGACLDAYLSIKAPAIAFSPALFAEVLERSARHGTRVHLDAQTPGAVDGGLALLAGAAPHPPGLGCTLPARWRRSRADAEAAVELRLAVRLVKGEEPGRQDIDPCRGMLALVDQLAGRARHVAVATHDTALARQAMARLSAAGTPCELELLFALPLRASVRVAREAGVGARLYVPYGQPRLPYRLSQAREHPEVLWRIARDLLPEGIRSPRPAGPRVKEEHRVRAS